MQDTRAATPAFDPAYLDDPSGGDAAGGALRSVDGDFIFHVELRQAPGAGQCGLRVDVPGATFRTALDASGAVTLPGAVPLATVLRPDVYQVERRGDALLFSAAPFGEPLREFARAAAPAGTPVAAGIHRQGDVSVRNLRWTRPAWPGLVPYQDYLGSRLELLDAATGERTVVFATDAGIEAPNYTPDGKYITFNSQGLIFKLEVGTHAVTRIDTGACTRNNNDHVISPDGRWLGISNHASGAFDGQSIVYKLPLGGGEPVVLTPLAPSYLHGWSPDGRHVIYTGKRDGAFNIYRTTTDGAGEETRLTSGPMLDDGSEYSHDGRHIYFNSARTGRMQVWRMNADGGEARQLTDDGFNDWFPHLSPDARQLVFLSYGPDMQAEKHPYYQHVYLRAMPAEGGAPRVVAYLYGGQGTINVPSWSPDGRYVAFVSHTGQM